MTLFALSLLLVAAFVHATWNLLLKRAQGGPAFQWLFAALSVGLYLPAVLAWGLASSDPAGLEGGCRHHRQQPAAYALLWRPPAWLSRRRPVRGLSAGAGDRPFSGRHRRGADPRRASLGRGSRRRDAGDRRRLRPEWRGRLVPARRAVQGRGDVRRGHRGGDRKLHAMGQERRERSGHRPVAARLGHQLRTRGAAGARRVASPE